MMSTNSSIPKKRWLNHITSILKDPSADNKPVCIHKVSQILRVINPAAYEPQLISLGPYHHCRDELFVMEHYKLIASKMSQKGCGQEDKVVEYKLRDIVKGIAKDYIADIRASYDRGLDANEDAIAWMMVIDSIFLVQFLLGFEDPKESCLWWSPRTQYLLDPFQSAYHSILKDMMKLENQIPTIILNKIIKACDNVGNVANDEQLQNMLLKRCKKLSPFKINETHPCSNTKTRDHLLAFLYYFIVPEADNNDECIDGHHHDEEKPIGNKDEQNLPNNKCLPIFKSPPIKLAMFSQLNIRFVRVLAKSKPVKFVIDIITCFPEVITSSISSNFKQKVGINDIEKGENSTNSSEKDSKGAPKVEEISIPSVSELKNIGVQFCPRKGSITTIEFDETSRKFYLPIITIDANTEVIIRNLVAYEAQAISCPSYLARYTELMNGIIDTPEDVKLLRQKGIVVSYLKKDEDVAELWNGMSRSIRLSHVPGIDETIKEVNKYYKSSRKVRFFEFTKECMICGWRILMLFLALVLMVLMAIQSFCDVYNCPRALAPVTDQPK